MTTDEHIAEHDRKHRGQFRDNEAFKVGDRVRTHPLHSARYVRGGLSAPDFPYWDGQGGTVVEIIHGKVLQEGTTWVKLDDGPREGFGHGWPDLRPE